MGGWEGGGGGVGGYHCVGPLCMRQAACTKTLSARAQAKPIPRHPPNPLSQDFLIDFGNEPGGPVLVHEVRYPGDRRWAAWQRDPGAGTWPHLRPLPHATGTSAR